MTSIVWHCRLQEFYKTRLGRMTVLSDVIVWIIYSNEPPPVTPALQFLY